VRGHPVRYWFKPSGKRNEALDRRVLRARGTARPPGPVGSPSASRADRTAAPAAVAARGRRPARAASFIIAVRAGKALRAPADPIQEEIN
jgi:hypothetical protein